MAQPLTQLKTRTVSSNDAKQHWGSMMQAASDGEAVIVESHGRPKAVVISPEAFEQLQDARERQRRAELLRRFDTLQRRLEGRNQDLSDEQVEEIAVRIGREVNAAVADRRANANRSSSQ